MTSYLGKTHTKPITADGLDIVDIDPGVSGVKFATSEFQALCPVTGQPDIYDLTIQFTPGGRSVESKSLKLYLWSFRDQGIYAENIAAVIARDLSGVLGRIVVVRAIQQVRGGLTLTASACAGSEK